MSARVSSAAVIVEHAPTADLPRVSSVAVMVEHAPTADLPRVSSVAVMVEYTDAATGRTRGPAIQMMM